MNENNKQFLIRNGGSVGYSLIDGKWYCRLLSDDMYFHYRDRDLDEAIEGLRKQIDDYNNRNPPIMKTQRL